MAKSEKKKKSKRDESDKQDKSKRRKSSNDINDESKDVHTRQKELATLLNNGLVHFPKLIDDLPLMLSSFDAGECVSIESVSNPKEREILSQMVSLLPLKYDERHRLWFKGEETASVSGYILKYLLERGGIVQPLDLTSSQRLSSHSAPLALLGLLTSFPDLKVQFPPLLNALLSGNCVDLKDIENEAVREALEKVFVSLQLEDNESGYSLPSDGIKDDIIRESLIYFQDIFENFAPDTSNTQTSSKEKPAGNTRSNECSGDAADDSSSSSDGESDGERRIREKEVQLATRDSQHNPTSVKGPAMPTKEELAAAQFVVAYDNDEEDEEEEEEVGPKIYNARKDSNRPFIQQQPLGFSGMTKEEIDKIQKQTEAHLHPLHRGGYSENQPQDESESSETQKREEWILNPGDSKLISELDASYNTNRKFQTGRAATKAAAALNKKQEEDSGELAEEEKRDLEKRGPTLMEKHQQKRAEKTGNVAKTGFAFKREENAMSHKNLDEYQVAKLVENAKDIGSRFGRFA